MGDLFSFFRILGLILIRWRSTIIFKVSEFRWLGNFLDCKSFLLRSTPTDDKATGYRRFLLLILGIIMGCGFQASHVFSPTVKESKPMLSELRFDGGYVFANRKHVVGIDVEAWGIASPEDIERLETSCKCVNVRVMEMNEFRPKLILVVEVAEDQNMVGTASLAVRIDAFLKDSSQRSLTFEFTHVASTNSFNEELNHEVAPE